MPLSADDVCEGEACSLSLRQLRGLQSESPTTEHNLTEANATDAADADVTTVVADSNISNISDSVAAEITPVASNGTAEADEESVETPESPKAESDTVQIYVPDPSETIEDSGDDDVGETISKINETLKQDQREQEEGGTCCFSGENPKDTCGTCYPMSVASYKSKCSRKSNCPVPGFGCDDMGGCPLCKRLQASASAVGPGVKPNAWCPQTHVIDMLCQNSTLLTRPGD